MIIGVVGFSVVLGAAARLFRGRDRTG